MLVVGYKRGNIGDGIATSLRMHYPAAKVITAEHRALCAEHIDDYEHLDLVDTVVFVNGQTHLDWIEDQPSTKIMTVVHNSLTATMIGVSKFAKLTMDKPYRKHIVMIGSMAYNHVLNGSAPYCAAKAGLAQFTKCVAWELAPKNYDVFCVHPSNTEGAPMSEETIQGLMRYRNLTREQAEAYWGATLPKERWLTKFDIGEVVAHLVSGKASYMSGDNVELAGGQR